jgi:hypothetical protein
MTSNEIDKSKDAFRGFAKSEEVLTSMSNSSRALQKTFEDFDAKVYADNIKVIANEFGITQEEANKLNEKMVKLSGNQVDPDNVREYATQFAKLGLSADEFANSLINQKSIGIYMDKGVDSVKELGLRMNKMSDTGVLAFSNVGININDMVKKVNTGKIKMSDMLSTIGKKMGNAGLANKQSLITEAFGAPGEDAGQKLDEYLQSFKQAQSTMTKADQERFDRNLQLETEKEKATKGLNIIAYKFEEIIGNASSKAWTLLAPFTEFFINSWYSVSNYISELFSNMGVSIDDISSGISWVLDLIGSVFGSIGKIVKMVWGFAKMIGKFLDFLLTPFGGLEKVFTSFMDSVKDSVKDIGMFAEMIQMLVESLTALASGDFKLAGIKFDRADLLDKAISGDKAALATLAAEQAAADKKTNKQKEDDLKAYGIKAAADKAEADLKNGVVPTVPTSNSVIDSKISKSMGNSATGSSSSVKNIHIQFEALQKFLGNQVIGNQGDSRRILDDLNEGLVQVLNNTNQLSTR